VSHRARSVAIDVLDVMRILLNVMGIARSDVCNAMRRSTRKTTIAYTTRRREHARIAFEHESFSLDRFDA
jgi:hypothetical protein